MARENMEDWAGLVVVLLKARWVAGVGLVVAGSDAGLILLS
jgi:hypothetical protein